jgi:hypothetical protein
VEPRGRAERVLFLLAVAGTALVLLLGGAFAYASVTVPPPGATLRVPAAAHVGAFGRLGGPRPLLDAPHQRR